MEPSSGKAKAGSFSAMGLEKDLFKGLHRMGYMNPTPVQRKALPIVLAGVDVVCMARTGSGKTCVFLLPLIQKLKAHDSNSGVRAVVLSPTRELALQTFKFAKDMAKFTDLRIVSIVGGDPIEQQFEALASRPDVIVATPGRLMHHIREIPTFNLKYVRYLCFDEADRLFEMGFAEQLNEIVRECPVERQTLLFSATMPKQLIQFSRAGLREPQLVRLDTDIKLSEELRVAYFATRSNEKVAALLYLVRTVIPEGQLTIIFTATKHHSEFIHYLFEKIGASSALVYGSMDQDARNENLRRFRKGEVQYLIVTDVAARGIDVPLLNNVINFHFTPMPKLFIHRCGRAARQGRIGFAMSLVDPEELAYMGDVHKFLGHDVCVGVPPTSTSSLAGIEENEISHNSKLYTTYTGESYDTKTMTPKLVHTGLLPQDVLDEENEFFKSSLEKDDTLSNMWRVCENAMKQYRRTRPEASHEGVKIAKALTKGKAIRMIHPLIAGVDPKRCDSAVVEKANFVRVLQTFRPAQTVFETGIGTGSTSQAVKKKGKQGSKESKGVEIMKALRRTTVSSLERNRADKKNGKLGDIHDDDDDDDDDDNEDDDGDEPAAFSSTYDDCDEDGDDALDGGCDEYPDNDVYDGDEPNQDDGPSNDHVYENDCDEDPNTTHSSKKQTFRLSAAEKKRLKKKGMSSQEIADYASQKAVAASYIVTDAGKKSKSFKDERFFMSYGNEDETANFAEESLQPQSNLRSMEAQNAMMLEKALLDLTPEDAVEMNKKKRTMRWDAKKRKFVKQTDEEAGLSRNKRQKMELGNGKMVTTSARPQGEMYEQWKKKSKREVSLAGTADEVDERPRPNFRYNTKVPDELRSANDIRKLAKNRDDNKLKNMKKDKRKKIEGKMRKAKNAERNAKLGKNRVSMKMKAIVRR